MVLSATGRRLSFAPTLVTAARDGQGWSLTRGKKFSLINRYPIQLKSKLIRRKLPVTCISNIASAGNRSRSSFNLNPKRNEHFSLIHIYLRPEDITPSLGDRDSE